MHVANVWTRGAISVIAVASLHGIAALALLEQSSDGRVVRPGVDSMVILQLTDGEAEAVPPRIEPPVATRFATLPAPPMEQPQLEEAALESQELAEWKQKVRRAISESTNPSESATGSHVCKLSVVFGRGGELIGATADTCELDASVRSELVGATFRAAPFPPLPPEARGRPVEIDIRLN